MRKQEENELPKNKDHCRASRQHLADRMWPAGRYVNRPGVQNIRGQRFIFFRWLERTGLKGYS
jgi:hypothetical protein